VLGQHLFKGAQSADANQMKELLAREREVLANVIVDGDA
jgi:hypothetical protein